jgi:hypothetical protein
MEHRWGARVHLKEPARLRNVHGSVLVIGIRNASLSGAFLETSLKPSLFSRVCIQPVAGAGEWLDAWVVREDDDGVGVEWLEPGSDLALELISARRRTTHRRQDGSMSLSPGFSGCG